MTPATIQRADWELPGWEVDAHTNSPPVDWSKVTGVTIHYPGSANTWTRTPNQYQVIEHVQASQRSYAKPKDQGGRGYSYGYNFQVWGEHSVEVRGDGFRNAANGSPTLNTPKISIQVRVPGANDDGQPATGPEIERVREIVAWAEQQAGRTLIIDGHRDVKSTGCPGAGLYQQVQDGVFRPLTEPAPPPTPPEEVDMAHKFIRIDGYADQFLALPVSAETKRRLGATEAPALVVESDATKTELDAFFGYEQTPL